MAAAGRRTWLRRATFDLIGLPPTPEEVAAFLADPSADAHARVVDRLLSSPRYGELYVRLVNTRRTRRGLSESSDNTPRPWNGEVVFLPRPTVKEDKNQVSVKVKVADENLRAIVTQ